MSREFTVVHTSRVGSYGTLVHAKTLTVKDGETFEKALSRVGLDICSLVLVFEGKQRPITSDWTKL